MNSQATLQFWKRYQHLPTLVRRRARKAYRLWKKDPNHPSLRFKPVDDEQGIYSVRVGGGYRALGILEADTMIWFWIGHHDEYMRRLKSS